MLAVQMHGFTEWIVLIGHQNFNLIVINSPSENLQANVQLLVVIPFLTAHMAQNAQF